MEEITRNYPVIDFKDIKVLTKNLKEYGVVVIENILSETECNEAMEDLWNSLLLISNVDKDNVNETWNQHNLPPQTRPGMFQALVGNLPRVWNLRSNQKIKQLFNVAYSELREEKDLRYVVSNDGVTIKPGFVGPYDSGKDWAHLDQTDIKLGRHHCIQGQIVLSNTSASFRASVKSHLIHENIIQMHSDKIDEKTNWLKINEKKIGEIKDALTNVNGHWQVPIYAKKGSFVMWFSTVVHSSKLQDKEEIPNNEDKWFGWRGVVYICYRPLKDFTQAQLKRKYKHVLNNRICNHWGTKVFKTDPSQTRFNKPIYADKIQNLIKHPEKVYEIANLKLQLSEDQKMLAGNVNS